MTVNIFSRDVAMRQSTVWRTKQLNKLILTWNCVFFCFARVLAICFPMRFQITGRRARLIILLIWIVALTTTIPWPLYFHLVSAFPASPEIRLCLEEWPSERDKDLYFILANVVFCYLLPLFLILLCYVMIWIRVWRRSIPTESKDAHIDRLQQRSKVVQSFFL